METASFDATLPVRAPDARWFPVDLHVPERRFDMATLDVEVLERSTFLDTRLDATLASIEHVTADRFAGLPSQRAPAWLFHTSFCGSTLLARAAHVPDLQVALKEPLVLRRLGDARHSGWSIDGLCDTTVRLLSRPWTPDGSVLVKATHAALNIAPDLLRASPESRAVLLTSTLDDFLVSNIKKTTETQAKVPELAERALSAGTLHQRLPAQALQPPDLLCAVALQWAAQRDLLAGLVRDFGERVRVLDFATLADDPENVVVACARWWRMPSPEDALRLRAREVAHRNAKAMSVEYSAEQRAREARMVQERFGAELARARDWAQRFVLPHLGSPLPMQPPRDWT
ncbi:hypothetical protein GOY17_15015 [Lysobacter soli]|uniref:hypothetical protein n=1 Tax=Lysobacter soli TaxID=453783 RepID=UPI0012ED6604|nr:hypothetical protein [Lysobacter soli]QGW66106.1 hypothetical protein GOY17_15015 [Lysobacter soli]